MLRNYSSVRRRMMLAFVGMLGMLCVPVVGVSQELSNDEILAIVTKQTSHYFPVRELYLFPPGRNKRIHFIRTNAHKLFVIDTSEDLAFYLQSGLSVPDKAKRKMHAYRSEFSYVVKKTVQDAMDNHDEAFDKKVIEIFAPKVVNLRPKTISDPPPPMLDSYHVSYSGLKGKHNFPGDLPLTAKIKVGDDTHILKTRLQYYSLPNMRVIKK